MTVATRTRLGTSGIVYILVLAVATFGAACATPTDAPSAPPATRADCFPSQPSAASSAVTDLLENMTLENKVAQLLITAFYGTTADAPTPEEQQLNAGLLGTPAITELIAAGGVGGVVFVRRNIAGTDQLAELAGAIQSSAQEHGLPGLLIAVDQEGGLANHLDFPPFIQFPAPPAFGRRGDSALVEGAARITARQLLAVGINTVLAPVVDVSHGDSGPMQARVYGESAGDVARLASAAVAAFGAEGIIAVGKHFPGLAATDVDSHDALPVIELSNDEWLTTDREAFRAVIASGVPAILVGHARVPAVDDTGTPAPLSMRIVQGELRDCLGFEGVVMTDALDMLAVGAMGTPSEVAVGAIRAGVDVLLIPTGVPETISAVAAAVQSGDLSKERIDEAVRRVLTLKEAYDLLLPPTINPTSDAAVTAAATGAGLNTLIAACAEWDEAYCTMLER